VGLRASAHLANEAERFHWHEEIEYLRDYMTEEKETPKPASGASKEEIALELMRFIASTTGFGKAGGGAGFTGKAPKSTEEQVDALLALYDRCKSAVR
jgi:hypothetical protein